MKVGESRAANLGHTSGISWVEGDAQVKPNWNSSETILFQKLPFPDASFDCYTVAFGIRYIPSDHGQTDRK